MLLFKSILKIKSIFETCMILYPLFYIIYTSKHIYVYFTSTKVWSPPKSKDCGWELVKTCSELKFRFAYKISALLLIPSTQHFGLVEPDKICLSL